VHLGQGLSGFGLVQLPWAHLSGLAAHSLDRGGAWRHWAATVRLPGPVGEDYEKHEGAAGIPFGVEAGSVGAHCTLFTAAWSDVAAEQGGECGIEGKDLGLSLGATTA
jgi:hypothetical protein